MGDGRGNIVTEVTIYGRTYHLRGEDGQDLARLAAIVDEKMKEVARSTGAADTLKVAIMAALNIADDYRSALRSGGVAGAADAPTGPGSGSSRSEERLARMVTLLDEVLAG